jgi:concentrative nucleoside transporter, CNT family
MSTDFAAPAPPAAPPPVEPDAPLPPPPMPWLWRFWIGVAVLGIAALAYFLHSIGVLTERGQAAYGIAVIIGVIAMCSANLNAVKWRTVIWGFALQLSLALFVLKFRIYGLETIGIPDGYAPGQQLFGWLGGLIAMFLDFAMQGARFVFGVLVDQDMLGRVFGAERRNVFAFTALPTIIFVSSFFTVLYYFGILQFIVRVFARAMSFFMGTSGAETLASAANVFMGQTEAPLIVKPYVARMTQSELLAMMVGGMATISGALMAVYIDMGADRIGVLATSVMAAPAALYLSKLLLPEMETPETLGKVTAEVERPHRNAIDAAASGASDGLYLALNVAAMLIAFIAFLALIDMCLKSLPTGMHLWEWLWQTSDWRTVQRFAFTVLGYGAAVLILRHLIAWLARLLQLEGWLLEYRQGSRWMKFGVLVLGYFFFLGALDLIFANLVEELTLQQVFSTLFAPLAFFMGVQASDIPAVADLLGTKLAANEFVAFLQLRDYGSGLSERSIRLATYALTGFANFASIGIQLGGIGAMAPSRRPDLARLGGRALFIGFLATVLNAAIAGMLLPMESEP